ncbi:MAG: N-acetylmuramoyl-L-alanine amidase [Nitrospirae bacterium]|nr:N-acetylmuramoyl-L-alanine amidase [Nitrospirota bacterium]
MTTLRISAIALILLLLPYRSAAEQGDVTLRYSLQDEMVRIVLQAESAGMVQKAKVHSSYTLVRVEFPREFKLSAPQAPGYFEYTRRGTNLFLNIKGLKWIKLLRLKSPPRLVIDAYLKSGTGKELTEQKPDTGARVPPPTPKEEASPAATENRVSTVVLDPGHGGYDLGIYAGGYSEKSLVLKISRSLRYKLRKEGKKVYLTRNDDRYRSLMKRILYVRKRSPDLVLSLHMTSSNHVAIYTSALKQVHGEDSYLLRNAQAPHVDDSRLVARRIGSSIMQELNIGVFFRELDIPVLSYSDSAAVLIELPGAEFFDYSRKNIELLVNSIVEGILAYEKG